MINLIKAKIANSTIIAKLTKVIRSGTVANKDRLQTETARSHALSSDITSVTVAKKSAASGVISSLSVATSSAAFYATSSVTPATSTVDLKSQDSLRPTALVQPIFVTQPAATPIAPAATPHSISALHSIVISQNAAVSRFASFPGAQPASTSQRNSTTLRNKIKSATVKKPAKY